MAIFAGTTRPITKRIVAIKLLPPQLAADHAFVQRFRREADAAARLDSPYVIAIHNYGEINDRFTRARHSQSQLVVAGCGWCEFGSKVGRNHRLFDHVACHGRLGSSFT